MQISERLVKLGHRVTVATSVLPERKETCLNGVNIIGFDISGNAVQGYRGETSKYRDFLLSSDFDVITNFAAQQWATDLMLPLLDEIRCKKVFVPTGFSGLYRPQYRQYFREMPDLMKKYDVNVFLSDNYRDINFAREHGVTKTVLIPNGAGENEFLSGDDICIRGKYGIPENDFLIILVGSHTGVKGHAEAIRIFARAKLYHTTFLIIGNNVGGLCTRLCELKQRLFNKWQRLTGGSKRLMVRSLSRRETVSAYRQADLFLFPSNVECSPIVLFECMASRTPFLATNVGNAAEIVSWTKAGQILPTRKNRKGFSKAVIGKSARMLEKLVGDGMLRKAMQDAGYQAWQKRFTWETIAASYERLYLDLCRENEIAWESTS